MENQALSSCHKKVLWKSFAGGLWSGCAFSSYVTRNIPESKIRSVLATALPVLFTFSFTSAYVGIFMSYCDSDCGKVSEVAQKKINEVEAR